MADPTDELLEDVDIGDGHFELDLADEDALLADDYDEKPMKTVVMTSDCGRTLQNLEDEDFIEIGVDEDLALAEESKNDASENGKVSRKAIVFDDSNNDDSDEGGKERTRFKTERNINAVPRPTTAIPETLDAVAVKAQPNVGYGNRGGRGGATFIKRGFRGGLGGRGGLPRGYLQPRFRGPHQPHQFGGPLPPIQIQHKHHMDIGPIHQQYHHPLVLMEQYSNSSHSEDFAISHQQPHQQPQQQPQSYHLQHHQPHHPSPVVQPPTTNIHVNPHFRGPRPQVNQNLSTMWNGSAYVHGNHNPNYQIQQQQQPYQNHQYQPSQPLQWTENTHANDYYSGQNITSHNNFVHNDDQYYNGVNNGMDQYYHHHQQHQTQQVAQVNYQQLNTTGSNQIPQQVNWNDSNYYSGQQDPPLPPGGPPQDMYNIQTNPPINQNTFNNRIQHQLQIQLQHKKLFLQNKKTLFKNNKFQVAKGRGGKVIHTKKEIVQNKTTPIKPARIETGALRKIPITNLQEVPVTNNTPQKKNIPEPEEEDEEMKAYRKKIEEQKKLREEILRQKEEKRKVAAQQKFQMLAARKKNAAEEQAVSNTAAYNACNIQQYQMVRVRLQDGRTVVKRLSTAQISKLKKISSGTRTAPQTKNDPQPKSRIVVVDNLSASTTQKQLEIMAKQIGKVERVQLNAETKRATVIFENTASAAAFVQKFQRKMVDLSMISLRMVLNADDVVTSSLAGSTSISAIAEPSSAASSSAAATPASTISSSAVGGQSMIATNQGNILRTKPPNK